MEYSKALSLLALLVETENFSQAGVWLKHAECLHMLQELEQAAMSYVKVLSLAPHHTETRMTLASLYSQLGMTEDALALLDAGKYTLNRLLLILAFCYITQKTTCIHSLMNQLVKPIMERYQHQYYISKKSFHLNEQLNNIV